jgi:hypothetical protein
MGADVVVGVNRAENANIVVIHIGAAGTPWWRERHKIEHGLNLRKREKVTSVDEEETYDAHIVAIREGHFAAIRYGRRGRKGGWI